MKKTIFLCAATLLTLVSCNDYLDTVPSRGDNEVLKSGEQIEALFNNSDIFNSKVSFLAASGDDIDLTMEMYNAMGYATDAYIGTLAVGQQELMILPITSMATLIGRVNITKCSQPT